MKKNKRTAFCTVIALLTYVTSFCQVSTISLESAKAQVKKFDDSIQKNAQLNSLLYRAEYFTKSDLLALLAQTDCNGIRVYHAIGNDGRVVMLIAGAASQNLDLAPAKGKRPIKASGKEKSNKDLSDGKTIILKSDVPCPRVCPPNGL